ERGAFSRALRLRGAAGVRMLFQHDPAEPIGTWLELREDDQGLFVRGQLTPGVARSREVLELLRNGALDGLSIGFRTVKAKKDAKSGLRRIVEADLWEARAVIARGFSSLMRERDAGRATPKGLTERVRHATRMIQQ